MTDVQVIEPRKTSRTEFISAVILILIVVLFAPFAYHFDLGPGPDSIEAVVWQYIDSSWYVGFRFRDPLRYLAYIFVRLLFVLQFIRYLLGKSSSKSTLVVAAYSELHVALLSLPVYISWLYGFGIFLSASGDPLLPVFLPIPILFIASLAMVLLDERRK